MPYTLIWSPTAKRALAGLPKEISERIIRKAISIVDNPHPFLERMVEYRIYKLRVGDYRAFVDIDEGNRTLNVLNVRHRKHAYK